MAPQPSGEVVIAAAPYQVAGFPHRSRVTGSLIGARNSVDSRQYIRCSAQYAFNSNSYHSRNLIPIGPASGTGGGPTFPIVVQ